LSARRGAQSREVRARQLRGLPADRCADQPRNSGGALVDLQGRLVGINAQILSPSGGNIGLGFAIPSTMAQNVAISLSTGRRARSKLGVNVQSFTPDIAENSA
jgi:S1-C subfamily serine protease